MSMQEFFEGGAFDPAAVKILTSAFDAAIEELHLDRGDPKAELVAHKIIECVTGGGRDPARLCALAVDGVGGS